MPSYFVFCCLRWFLVSCPVLALCILHGLSVSLVPASSSPGNPSLPLSCNLSTPTSLLSPLAPLWMNWTSMASLHPLCLFLPQHRFLLPQPSPSTFGFLSALVFPALTCKNFHPSTHLLMSWITITIHGTMYLWLSWGAYVIICKALKQPILSQSTETSFSLRLFTLTLSGLDHGEMMEMQGFGGSPSSWQQVEVTTQESLCQSCSTAGSNVSFDYPTGCTCIHDPLDIHTYVLRMRFMMHSNTRTSCVLFLCECWHNGSKNDWLCLLRISRWHFLIPF